MFSVPCYRSYNASTFKHYSARAEVSQTSSSGPRLSPGRYSSTASARSAGPRLSPGWYSSTASAPPAAMSPMNQSQYEKDKRRAVFLHFLDKHQLYLIKKTKNVNKVVEDLLEQQVITKAQHDQVLSLYSKEKMMRELYQCMQHWGNEKKDIMLQVLRDQNYNLIRDMELAEKNLPQGFKPLSPEIENFLQSNEATLKSSVTMVDPILDDLLDCGLLEIMEYYLIKEKLSPSEKMEDIIKLINKRGDYFKWALYQSLYKYNYMLIKELEDRTLNKTPEKDSGKAFQKSTPKATTQELVLGYLGTSLFQTNQYRPSYHYNYDSLQNEKSHFVDRHCWDLIRVILLVDPVLDDLLDEKMITQEQYNHIMEMTSPKMKMVKLGEISNNWWHTEKDKLYLSLRDHNYHHIRLMEISDGRTRGLRKKHFLNQHQSELIRIITVVNAVLEDLLAQKLLTQDQYNLMLRKETSQEKMVILFEICSLWDDFNKDMIYLSLRKENYAVIRELEVEHKLQPTGILESSSEMSGVDGNEMRIVFQGRYAITCSICLDFFMEPVTLSCGHSFCMNCITKTWHEQFEGEATCPHCRLRFKRKPELKMNTSLSEIVECYRSHDKNAITAGKFTCSLCTGAAVPAIKRCLYCESFLCEDHLNVHCSLPDVLLEVAEPLETRKCSIHGKILDYYCKDDTCLICSSCCISEDHRGHHIQVINEAAGEKKEKLRIYQEKLGSDMSATWKKIKDLQDCKGQMEKDEMQFNTFLTANIKHILEENGLPIESSVLKKEDLSSVLAVLENLEINHSELSAKIEHIEMLCNLTDPFKVISDAEARV